VPALSPARVLPAIGGIYVAQSIVGGLTFQALPAVLRSGGAALSLIGAVSLLMLPQALKFLWSPFVERWRLPADGTRRSRRIILTGQALAVVLVLAVAGTTDPVALFALLALAAVVTATLDIACDGFAVEQLPPSARGWGNVMQVGGGYVGMMLGGGLFLVGVARLGWATAAIALAVLLAIATVPLALLREPPGDAAVQARHRPALMHGLTRPLLRRGLLTVAWVQSGLRVAIMLMGPFLIDRGFGLEALGLLTGLGGTAASLLGTLAAAQLIGRFGAGRLLWAVAAVQAALFLGLAVAAHLPGLPQTGLAALALALSFATGAGFVVLYTAMMGWAAGPQPGIDFTLLQCADALVAAVTGLAAGSLAQHLGYAPCFLLAAALALTAAAGLARRGRVRMAA